MTANEQISSNPVRSSSFYQYDSYIDEESYAAAFEINLQAAGFPSTLGFLIDTSRNGWAARTARLLRAPALTSIPL